MRESHFKLDYTIFSTVVALLMLGIAMVYSASSFKAAETYEDSRFFLKSHVLKVLIGFVLMLIVARVDYRFWLKVAPVFLVLSFCALVYVVVSPDIEAIRGSKRWLTLGPLQFQPSELARISLVLFLSAMAGRIIFKRSLPERHLGLSLGALAIIIVPILLQPDLGTALLTAAIAMALIFVSGQKLRYLFLLTAASVPAGLMMLMSSGYQKHRITQYLASLRGEEISWQTKQSLIALGNGGFLGLGLGGSKQKFHFLPDPFTDFIYAIVGEELGILGTILVLALFFILIWRGLELATKAPDFAGKLLGIGLTLNIAVYVFANAGVVLNLLPTTGIPMPLMSYGGTALILNLFGIGILLNIASQVRVQHLLYPVKNARERNSRLGGLTGSYFDRFAKHMRRPSRQMEHGQQPHYSMLSVLRQNGA